MYLLEELLHCALVPVLDEQAVAFSHLAEASYARRSEPACRHLVKPRNDPCGYLTPELTCRRSSSPSGTTYAPATNSPATNKDAGRRRQVQRTLARTRIPSSHADPGNGRCRYTHEDNNG